MISSVFCDVTQHRLIVNKVSGRIIGQHLQEKYQSVSLADVTPILVPKRRKITTNISCVTSQKSDDLKEAKYLHLECKNQSGSLADVTPIFVPKRTKITTNISCVNSQKSDDLKEAKYSHLECRFSELFSVIRIVLSPNRHRGSSFLCQAGLLLVTY